MLKKSQNTYLLAKILFMSYQWSRQQICPSWSREIDDYNRNNVQALSIIKARSMLSPKEAELQSPLPDNGANLLSLQETP